MKNNKKYLGVMIDCSRNAVMNLPSIKRFIKMLSQMGYNMLQLYTEDTYEIEGEPYFGYLRGRYSKAQLKEIDDYASQNGIEVIPCIQTLAHLNSLTRWDVYNKIIDCNDILLADDEKTYELIDKMFATQRECFKTDLINIGMDEAHMVGLGKYLDKHGYENRHTIMIKHLIRVNEIASKYGFKPLMWSDMFFRLASGGEYYVEEIEFSSDIISQIPDAVTLIYWDYYSKDTKRYEKMLQNHKKLDKPIWYAGGVWTWTGFAPTNSFSIDTIDAAVTACKNMNVENMLFTMWGDNGGECSYFAGIPSLFYAAQLYKGNTEILSIKNKFLELFGICFDDFMLLDNANNVGKEIREFENPSKYMLYNDLFTGVFDSTVEVSEKEKFKTYSLLLDELVSNFDFGYLFKTQKSLLDVLHIKYDLGLRINSAYANRSYKDLEIICWDIDKLLLLIEAFYTDFQTQWDIENKPNGFEIQDIRIGGLIHRIKNCKAKIMKLISGELTHIEELDEIKLDYFGDGPTFRKQSIAFNNYAHTVSANNL